MKWSEYVNPDILRFGYDQKKNELIDEVIEEFRGNKTVSWHEVDGAIEVCVYQPAAEFYEEKEPVLVEVWEWDLEGVDDEGYKCHIPLKHDFFLGLIGCSKYMNGVSAEGAKNLINKEHRLKYRRGFLWKCPVEDALRKALNALQKKAV